ncbi:hypothetical protein [Nakamurella deserti]|uniref:hypothetical protein n=1 Tax=Nakamurella deserti TaxID=2164074 RepID=UPI0013008DCF|nr:hypothetical protein [Nakamurella deserti]
MTVTEPGAPGTIAAFAGPDRPDVSDLNFEGGQTVPDLVAVPRAADGSVTLADNSTGPSHLIVDVADCFRGW